MLGGATLGGDAASQRPLYRDDDPSAPPRKTGHLMYDARVVRGLTPAATHSHPATGARLPSATGVTRAFGRSTLTPHESATTRTASATGVPANVYLPLNARVRGPTPFDTRPAARSHEPVDLTPFLVEVAHVGSTLEASTSTDDFKHRALPAHTGMRVKTGMDASTNAHIFDFDEQVAPLVAITVAATLETAVLELTREAELTALSRRTAAALTTLAGQETVASSHVQALDAALQSKSQRVAAATSTAAAAASVMRKTVAHSLARAFISGMASTLVQRLREEAYFTRELELRVRNDVLPALYDAVDAATTRTSVAHNVVDAVITAALGDALALRAAPVDVGVQVQFDRLVNSGPVERCSMTLGPITVQRSHTAAQTLAATLASVAQRGAGEEACVALAALIEAAGGVHAMALWHGEHALEQRTLLRPWLDAHPGVQLHLRPAAGAWPHAAPLIAPAGTTGVEDAGEEEEEEGTTAREEETSTPLQQQGLEGGVVTGSGPDSGE